MSNTIAVRSGEELDNDKLVTFLRSAIKDLPEGELTIRQFGEGYSNLTYALQIGDWEAVLRRPPLGPVAARAHDMEREFNVLSALHPIFNTVPEPIVFSDDLSVVGSPFMIMERRHGVVLNTSFPEGTKDTFQHAKRVSEIMVDKIVELHSIDYKKTELVNMVHPDGFLERQVSGWIGRYGKAKTSEIPELTELIAWLQENIPVSPTPTIIHYDFKLNNAMFSPDFTEMTGLFDWEMTTVGDPLADLGVAMGYWIEAGDSEVLHNAFGAPAITIQEGFYTRKEFIERYAEKSGRDVQHINYYIVFAYFKVAVVCQQMFYRYKKGQTTDSRFANLNKIVHSFIQHALTIKEES
ncbi:phosphotransferase family protein [Sporosarcina sp. CAU 1771]